MTHRLQALHYRGLILAIMTIASIAGPSQAATESVADLSSPARDPHHIDAYQPHPRLFVLSDIGNEPDDQMSLTRLLLYANDIDIEGLVAVTSCWQPHVLRPDMMHVVLGHYAQALPTLRRHNPRYPSAEALSVLIRSGQPEYGLAPTGRHVVSDGARLLIAMMEKPDSRPLHISIWGGANTLAIALKEIRRTHDAASTVRILANIRVYSISDQDNAGPWIRREFPNLSYIVDPSRTDGENYSIATWTGISGDMNYRNGDGADFTPVSNSWLDRHIRSKGPMGKSYPQYAFIMEGDTPAFLGLIDNGLDAAQNPGWGGWGGRYVLRQPLSESRPIWTSGGDFYPGKPNGADTVVGVDGKLHTSTQATIWRWREAFQNDFAARMDWTIHDPAHANHPPRPAVNGDTTTGPVYRTLQVGQTLTLSTGDTRDPDNDQVAFSWFIYTEASSAESSPVPTNQVIGRRGEEQLNASPVITLSTLSGPETTIRAIRPGLAHLILIARDSGRPPLTRYRRIIFRVNRPR